MGGVDPSQPEAPSAYSLAAVQASDAYFSIGIVSSQASSDPLMTAGVVFTSTLNDEPFVAPLTNPLSDPTTPTTPSSPVSAATPAPTNALSGGQGGGGNASAFQPSGPATSPLLGTIPSAMIAPMTNQQLQTIASQSAMPGPTMQPLVNSTAPTGTTTGGTGSPTTMMGMYAAPTNPPVANNDSYTVTNGTLTTTAQNGVLANDSANGAGTLYASMVSSPMHGMVSLNGDGSFNYTAYAGFSGSDGFTYHATAGMQSSNVATVSLAVTAAPAPLANNDSYSVTNGTLTTTAANGVLANDQANGAGTLFASMVSSPMHGMVSLNGDGSFSYTGYAGFSGQDGFTYHATAGMQTSNVATVSLAVTAVPTGNTPILVPTMPTPPTSPPTSPTIPPMIMPPMPPTANNDTYSLSNGGIYTLSAASGVLIDDFGTPGQSLSAVLDSGPSHGTLALSTDGSFTFTPALNFVGSDAFTYHDVAGGLSSNVATVTLYIGDGRPSSFTWMQTQPTAPTFAFVGPQTNAEGDTVTLPIQATANGGSLTYAALNLPVGLGINSTTGIISGTVDYAAAEYFGGVYATTIVASNSAGGSATENITWTINDTPRSPIITSIANQSNTAGDTISLQV